MLGLLCPLLAIPLADFQEPRSRVESPERPVVEEPSARAIVEAAPKRGKLGRMRGVRLESDVVFEALPAVPHQLVFSAAFPKRTRFVLESAGGRRELYRLGEVVMTRTVLPGATEEQRASSILRDEARIEPMLDLALRRALFFWPDGIPFTGDGAERRAALPGVGELRAALDAETGLPTRIEAVDASGVGVGALTNVRWVERSGRFWPHSLEFRVGDDLIWKETVRTVEDEWLFNDAWFLPADRASEVFGDAIRADVRLRARNAALVRRKSLSEPTGLRAAAKKAIAEWDEWVQSRPMRVASGRVGLVLDDQMRAVAIEWEAPVPATGSNHDPGESSDELPEGWTLRKGVTDWVHLLGGGSEGAPETALEAGLEDEIETLRTIAARSRRAADAEATAEIVLRGRLSPHPGRGRARGWRAENWSITTAAVPVEKSETR